MTTIAPEQLTLNLAPLTEPDYETGMTLDERYAAWIDANPHVLDAFEQVAAEWLAVRPRVGVKALAEQLRWRSGLRTEADPWKVNNSYVSRVARDLLARRPEWVGRIETRTLASERAA